MKDEPISLSKKQASNNKLLRNSLAPVQPIKTLHQQQKGNIKLKMSKSSQSIFFKKPMKNTSEFHIEKQEVFGNPIRTGEMEALFKETSMGDYSEFKEKANKIQRGTTINRNYARISKNMPQKDFRVNKKGSQKEKQGPQIYHLQKNKIQTKKGSSELTEPFTPNPNQKLEENPQQNKEKETKQYNFMKVKIHQKQEIQDLRPANKIVIGDFVILKKIGKGIEGQVHLAVHKQTGIIFAIKIVYRQFLKNEKNHENFFREVKIHLHLNDKNVIKLYTVFSDSKNIYMLLQPMLDGNLFDIRKKYHRFSQNYTSKVVLNICKGVRALHDKDIFHRDLKLQNVLINEGIAKIGDLGCAVHSFCMRRSSIGSPSYLSPEQMGNRFYTKKIDIWSVGVITYQLLYGQSPFQKQIEKSLFNQQELPHFSLKFPQNIQISEVALDFIKKTLQKNPNTRIDVNEALQHPFIGIKFHSQSPL